MKNIYLSLFFILYALWGVAWSVPYIDIGYTSLWYLLLLSSVFFLNNRILSGKITRIYLLVLLLISIYALIGLPSVLNAANNSLDVEYTLMYELRFILNALVVLFIMDKVRNVYEFKLSFMYFSIALIIIYSIIHWKYFYVFNQDYLGVVIADTGPLRTGKNSLATSTAIMFPLLLGSLFHIKGLFYKITVSLGIVAILLIAINIQSRSMILIMGVEMLVFYLYLSKLRSIKMHVIYSIAAVLVITFTSNISVKDFAYKQNKYSDNTRTGLSEYAQYDTSGVMGKYLNSHRGWLLTEAISGYANSSLLGHGIGTYRIRPTNRGSRTETHNDYFLLLYEMGTIGILLFAYILYDRIRDTLKVMKIFKDPMIIGSLASIIGLIVAMFFINIIHTLIFWTIFSLNLTLVRYFRKYYNMPVSIDSVTPYSSRNK